MNNINFLGMSAVAISGIDQVSNFVIQKSIKGINHIVKEESKFYITFEKAQCIERITHIFSLVVGFIVAFKLQEIFGRTADLKQEVLRSRRTIDELQDHLKSKPKELENKLMQLAKILQTGLEIAGIKEVLGKEWSSHALAAVT
jgi:serine kinase of HPr protein (carbohydrate metabolism regulator)